MNHKIQWGIIGLGKIAHKFAQDLNRTPGAVIAAVGSRNKEKAAKFAREYHAIQSYGSYIELARDPSVDIVYIATPHAFHQENTILCLEHGKAVLCEKPMGLDRKQVEKMCSLARAKKRFLMEALWTRFIPATRYVLEQINSGIIGEIKHLKADFGFIVNTGPESRLINKSKGGGALLDIGIYPLLLAQLILGRPRSIAAKAIKADNGIDLYCAAIAQYDNDAVAIMESSFISDTPTEAMIYGALGYIKLPTKFHQAATVEIYLYKDKQLHTIDIPFEGNGYVHEIEHVHKCLQERRIESPLLPLNFSLEFAADLDRIKQKIGVQYDT